MGNHLGACTNLSLPKKVTKSSKAKVKQECHLCMANEKVEEKRIETEIPIENRTEDENAMAANESGTTMCKSHEPLINLV